MRRVVGGSRTEEEEDGTETGTGTGGFIKTVRSVNDSSSLSQASAVCTIISYFNATENRPGLWSTIYTPFSPQWFSAFSARQSGRAFGRLDAPPPCKRLRYTQQAVPHARGGGCVLSGGSLGGLKPLDSPFDWTKYTPFYLTTDSDQTMARVEGRGMRIPR